jgi:hypothetical protein
MSDKKEQKKVATLLSSHNREASHDNITPALLYFGLCNAFAIMGNS